MSSDPIPKRGTSYGHKNVGTAPDITLAQNALAARAVYQLAGGQDAEEGVVQEICDMLGLSIEEAAAYDLAGHLEEARVVAQAARDRQAATEIAS